MLQLAFLLQSGLRERKVSRSGELWFRRCEWLQSAKKETPCTLQAASASQIVGLVG
jgi:hypothetical protein